MKRINPWTLLQDVDGCLANFNSAFMDLLIDVNGPPKNPLKLECWHWPQEECGYTQEQVDATWDAVDAKWWLSLDPLPGAIKTLDRIWWLQREGLITPYFVTGRLPWAQKATCDWLELHGGIQFPQVICTSQKAIIARAFSAEAQVAAVEDKPSILASYLGKLDRVYIIDYPYNHTIGSFTGKDMIYDMPGFSRVIDSFEAIVDLEKVITNKEAPVEAEAV